MCIADQLFAYLGEQIKKNMIGGSCGMYGREKCAHGFSGET
jgi:hypothetical protein